MTISTFAPDFFIIGGGIIGINLALEAKRRYPKSRIVLIEKEKACGLHASGRNSGVLHAGFYYTADTLKARFTKIGNDKMREYCLEKRLKINECGKLVVVKCQKELSGLAELKKRGDANGIELHEISEKEATEIEPRAKTFEKALFSPKTATVDPTEVMNSLVADSKSAGIEILTSTAYISRSQGTISTTSGNFSPGFVINAAGLYADRIASDFGFSKNFTILPFKGLYLYGAETERLKTNIYPVPDLENPFLGVHFTLTASGKVKLGPTAIPAFWREHYKGMENFDLNDFAEIVRRQIRMFCKNSFSFRKLAWREIKKYYRPHFIRLGSELLKEVDEKQFSHWGAVGIRAQLFNIKDQKLEMDFQYEGDKNSFHVLNAVSPAFTCSIPFCEFLFDQIETFASPGIGDKHDQRENQRISR
jgi:L-2-hydroxyglutarate oxidase LhgO